MAFHFEDIKKFITDYFNDNLTLTKLKSRSNSASNVFNKELFELEVLIQEIKGLEKIDLNLNPTIYSHSIAGSFNTTSLDTYFKSVDYQLNFLYHLAITYNISVELHEYINAFVKEFKNQLSYTDIKITDSGATRIFTNLRFAVNDLRNLGLVLRHNDNGKRILLPSVFGLFVLIYIYNNQETLSREIMYKPFNSLRLTNYQDGFHDASYQFDSLLGRTIKRFDTIDLIDVIGSLPIKDLTTQTKEALHEIIKTYTAYVLDILEISNDGIKAKKGYEKKTKEFIAKAEDEKIIPGIHSMLLKLLRELGSSSKG